MKWNQPERMCHTVILLFESNDESMYIFDFVFEHIDQTFNSLFLLNQIIAKTRSIDHGKNWPTHVSQKVAFVVASFLGYLCTVEESKTFKAF
jgi:hypothetical protein